MHQSHCVTGRRSTGSVRSCDGSDGLLHLGARGSIASNDARRARVLFVASSLALATLETAEVLDAAVATILHIAGGVG